MTTKKKPIRSSVRSTGRSKSKSLGKYHKLALVAAIVIIGGVAAPILGRAAKASPNYSGYMAFGDSITYGIGTSNPALKSYPAQAGVRGHGIGSSCVLSYDCSSDLYIGNWWPSYIDSISPKPKTAIFLIGINDINRTDPRTGQPVTPAEIESGLVTLKQAAQQRGIRAVFGTITPPPSDSGWAVIQPVRLTVNNWIRKQANHVEYARALQGPNQYLLPKYESQYHDVHVNDAGAKAMAKVLDAWINHDHR